MLREDAYPETVPWQGSVPAVDAAPAPRQGFAAFMERLSDLFLAWEERIMQRRTLMQLDEHQLKDIGLSRSLAEEEWRKPFWKP